MYLALKGPWDEGRAESCHCGPQMISEIKNLYKHRNQNIWWGHKIPWINCPIIWYSVFNDQGLCFPPTTYSFPPNLLLQSPLPYSTFTAHFRAVSHLIYATPPAPTPHLRSSSWLIFCFIVKSLQGPDRSITALPHHFAGEESESHEVGTGHGVRVATLRLASDSRSNACTRPTPGVPEAVLGRPDFLPLLTQEGGSCEKF